MAGPAYGICRGELATLAAAVVGIIANGPAFELAGFGITAVIVPTGLFTTTVAVFALLDETIAALAARVGGDSVVVGKATGFDAVAAHGRADISNRTR